MAGPVDRSAHLAETTAPHAAALEATAAPLALEATLAGDPQATRLAAATPTSERIGRFVVLREVGRGAMGVVFAAYDEELDRKVALKLVELDEAPDASLGRNQLLREAQALARLAHPNVVAVHEAGVHRGAVFLAMEFVDGVDLQRWLAAELRPWQGVVAAFRQAGEGLLAAHRVGLVHRDFKPSNVLVGDDGRVRVADFGLAARRDGPQLVPVPQDIDRRLAPSGRSSRLAGTIAGIGALVGTPAYMAPEQHRCEPVTAASDQFSFCVALFEALYGHRPFSGDTLDALARDVLTAELPATSPDPSVPAWLYAIVRRGLAREPAARFPDMQALLAELARDPEAERARRRLRLRQLAAAVLVTLLVVAGGVSLYRAAVRAAHERRADERLTVLRDQLADLRAAGKHDEAAQVFAAFVDLPDNRGAAALARAYREWADVQTDHGAALDALAGAYLHAEGPDDQVAALRGLALRLAARRAFAEAAVALDTLDARAPALATDPELAGLRLSAALARRDLPAARAAAERLAGDDPRRGYAAVLEHLSHATAIPIDRIGRQPGAHAWLALDDYDGDGRPEIVTHAPARGDDVVLVLRTDPNLTEVASLRTPATTAADGRTGVGNNIHFPRILPAGFAGAPLLYVATRNPGGDGSAQMIHHIVPLTPGARPELSWPDSPTYDTAIADLDRDGAPEFYVAHLAYARHLLRLTRGTDGAWQRRPAHPGTDAAGSDIMSVEAGDLDGDGAPELVVAVGAWNAYDVRVLRADDRGELQLVARKTLGYVSQLALPRVAGGRRLIAALKRDEYPSERRFGPEAPLGEPAGVYVLELAGGALAVRQFFPARDGDGPPHDYDWLRAGDLDGDARDDLVVEDGSGFALVRGDGDGFLAPLHVADGRPLLAADLDDDPAAELLIGRVDDPANLLALGVGDAPTPALPRPALAAMPVPTRVADPAIAAAWRRAEDLAAIGLLRRAADELARVAGLSRHASEDMLFRAAQLYAAAGEHAAAAERFLAAAARPDLADAALAGAIKSRRARREFAAAAALAERRAALPGLKSAALVEAEAELAALRRVGAARPELALRFDRPLDPAWRIADPLALAREPGTGALSLETTPNTVIAELPLAWDGGSVALTVDAAIEHADWGSSLDVVLSPADDDVAWLALSFSAGGQTARPVRRVHALTGTLGTTHSHAFTIPPDMTGRFRAHFRHDPELDAGLVELALPGGEVVRQVLPHQQGVLPTAPAPGPLRLRLLGRTIEPEFHGRLLVHAIDLLGVHIDHARADPGPDAALRRLLVEGELGDALARLAALPPGGEPDLWRAEVLAGLGRLDEAAAALRTVAADPALRPQLAQLLARDRDAFFLAARRGLGPALNDLLASAKRLSAPWRPTMTRRLLGDLATHPLDPPATPSPDPDQWHCEALLLRGLSWQYSGRLDLARRDLEAAWRVLDDPARAPSGRELLRSEAIRRLLELAAAQQDVAAARRWLAVTLDESPIPELSLEQVRARRDLQALLSPADWDDLAARAARPRP